MCLLGCGVTTGIGIDVNPEKFTIARQLGATDCINPREFDAPIQQVILDLTEGGETYSVECVGNVEVMGAGQEITGFSGTLTNLRSFNPRPNHYIAVLQGWSGVFRSPLCPKVFSLGPLQLRLFPCLQHYQPGTPHAHHGAEPSSNCARDQICWLTSSLSTTLTPLSKGHGIPCW